MSLWTPEGERPVRREATRSEGAPDEAAPRSLEDLTPEQREQAEAVLAEMAEVRRQIAEAPAADVVANHLMGLYELAAIHLSEQPPHFDEASVAIDAMRLVIEGMPGRLGDHEPVLRNALHQIQMAFVDLKSQGTPS